MLSVSSSVLQPSLASLRPLRLARGLQWRAPARAGGGKGLGGPGCGDGAACAPCPDPQVFPLPAPVQTQLNRQIGQELTASLQYTALAAHLSGVAVSLAGASSMFRANAEEELEHAAVLGRWLVRRGGHYVPVDIPAPETPVGFNCQGCAWETLRAALCTAVHMERQVTESLLLVHQVARRCKDAPTADFISKTMLSEQVQALYFLGQLQTKLGRVRDSPSGLNLLDESLQCQFKKRR